MGSSPWLSPEPNRCFLQLNAESIRHDISIAARCMASNSRPHSLKRRGDFGVLAYKMPHALQAKLHEASGGIRSFCGDLALLLEQDSMSIFMASSYDEVWWGMFGTGCQASPNPFASISCRPVKMRMFWLCPGQISFEAGYLTFVEVWRTFRCRFSQDMLWYGGCIAKHQSPPRLSWQFASRDTEVTPYIVSPIKIGPLIIHHLLTAS